MNGIGYLGAFLGGALALLSPCGGLLLPAFFANTFAGPARLLSRTAVFYAGLAAVLVPLGMGSAMASTIIYGHQAVISVTAGTLLIVLGLVQIAGGGFAVPGLARLRQRVRGESVLAAAALGAVSGLAGFCAGPILGAVLTVAAASGQPVRGGLLLAVYAAGMTVPLLAISAAWARYGPNRLRWLRGRGVRVGRLHLHTTSALAGLILIGLGVLFLRYQGIGGLTGLLTPPGLDGWNSRLQAVVGAIQAHVPDPWLLAVLAATVIIATTWRLARSRHSPLADDPTAGASRAASPVSLSADRQQQSPQ